MPADNPPVAESGDLSALIWPTVFSPDEREILTSGLIFLAIHHDERRKEFAKDAADPRFKRERKGCLAVAAHHTEELYKVGELLAKCGMRNGWPRPMTVYGNTLPPDAPAALCKTPQEIARLT